MIGLDCNILVQLAFADHPANSKTVRAVEAELRAGVTLAIPSLVATEFLHVCTDPRRFSPPLAMSEAVKWLEDLLASQGFCVLEASESSLQQTLRWMSDFRLGRKRVLDTHLAAILYCAGVPRVLTSNPTDFAVFGILETVVP